MTNSEYIIKLLQNLNDPNKENLVSLYTFLTTQFPDAKGSSNNKHQGREGGYYDHVADCIKFGKVMYDGLQGYRALPFSFNDVIIVIALHDLEKPYKYSTHNSDFQELLTLDSHGIREEIIKQYKITLSPLQQNGLDYIHGEGDHYSKTERVKGPLAAFCHCLDTISARIYFNDGK